MGTPVKRRRYWIPVLFLLLAGCAASMQDMLVEQRFEERSQAFDRAIRWSQYQKAGDFLQPGSNTSPDMEALARVRVIDVAFGHKEVMDKGRKIRQSMTIRFYRKDELVERTTTAQPLWVYDSKAREWFLESGFPQF